MNIFSLVSATIRANACVPPSNVNFLGQMPYFAPRTVPGAFNLEARNTKGLWGSSVASALLGAGSDSLLGVQ